MQYSPPHDFAANSYIQPFSRAFHITKINFLYLKKYSYFYIFKIFLNNDEDYINI